MRYETTAALVALLGVTTARPFHMKREVPQEHSHQQFVDSVSKSVNLDNKLGLKDAVFPLLGNKAAVGGLEDPNSFADLDCLQQATADLAFTNAKGAGDVKAQADALVYRTLERNTASVGLKSNLCTSQKAVNKEIAALSQHQDAAADGAAAINKQIELDLAIQLESIGADVQLALLSATFAPGKIGDPTAKGNTCDVADDPVGCGISQKLIVAQVSAAEIKAAVAKAKIKARAVNVQTFTGNLGGAPPAVEFTEGADRPFSVKGDTFLQAKAALGRSCDVQHNACANAANSKQIAASSADCETQNAACRANIDAAAASVNKRAALDFGACGSPAIEFGPGFDGRKEDSFQAVNQADFNHGSALNIKVITQFNCDQLVNKCKADGATVDACNAAAAKANGLKGQAAADAFNNALGV